MEYFLRFTQNPERDLIGGTSLHFICPSDVVSKEAAAEVAHCDPKDVAEVRGQWAQVLPGLCGFWLRGARTVEQAIEAARELMESERHVGAYDAMPAVLFEGELADGPDVPDGDLFIPFRVVVGDGAGLEFLQWRQELDLPDPEELLANPGSFVLPGRGDQQYAVLAAVAAAAVREPVEKERLLAGWQVLDAARQQGAVDVAAAAARGLARACLKTGIVPPQAQEFAPLLRAAKEE